jgi:hypothetical protein
LAKNSVACANPQHQNTIPLACSRAGIQVFADDLTGFGGLARSALDEVREELPGAHVLYFSLRPTDSGGGGEEAASGSGNGGSRGGSRGSDALSEALAVAELSERCAAYVPLRVPRDAPSALPLLRFPLGWRGSDYLRGGLLGAAIDTITLPLRLAGEQLNPLLMIGVAGCSVLFVRKPLVHTLCP